MKLSVKIGIILILAGIAYASYNLTYNLYDTAALVINAILPGIGLAFVFPKQRK